MNLDYLTASKYLYVMNKISEKYDYCLPDFFQSISPNQIKSKIWLCEELGKLVEKKNLSICIAGSWFGFPLIDFLSKKLSIKSIDLFDKDPFSVGIVNQYIKTFNCPFIINQYNEDFWKKQKNGYDILINTSSEHMKEDFYKNKIFNDNPLLVIQSCNKRSVSEHVNCVDSVDELIDKNKITKVFYKGEISQQKKGEKRFMVIGNQI